MTYSESLEATKANYPFDRWREVFDDGLEQYTEENCNASKAIFDKLIVELNTLGEGADEAKKVVLFKDAVVALNDLSDADESLIETGEREDLCELIDKIGRAAGINPEDYGEGEGIASEWREW